MFNGKFNVIGFSILLSLIGALVAASRKYYLTKIGVHAVTVIDSILTGTIIVLLVLTHMTPTRVFSDISKLSLKDWLICAVTSFAIAISILIGRNLLLHNDLAYLDIIDGGVDLVATAAIAYFFYKEKMTPQKIIGLILVLIGIAVLH